MPLSPVQQLSLDRIRAALRLAPVVGFVAAAGCGASRVLQAVTATEGGCLLTVQDMMAVTAGHSALRSHELVTELIADRLREHALVVVDDFAVLAGTGGPIWRPDWMLRTAMRRIMQEAVDTGAKLVLSGRPLANWENGEHRFGSAAIVVEMSGFGAEDYAAIASNVLGPERAAALDLSVLHRHSAHLSAHQLVLGFRLFDRAQARDTDALLDLVERHVNGSNTRLEEVEPVRLEQLVGHEAIVDALTTHLVMPMEQRELALRLDIRPKRGVLLYGPPGTGKTSIGRALAHRMKGKFFLIDGTFVTEPADAFHMTFHAVVEHAKRSAPSVLFIDDADVLFGLPHVAGLTRYLLSLLDGVESQTASQVCVMMTAMDAGRLPPALIRSGRVELWLETRMPDRAARARILERWLGDVLPPATPAELDSVAGVCEGFTPADLRRLSADAKALYAADFVCQRATRRTVAYLDSAAGALIGVRRRLAELM